MKTLHLPKVYSLRSITFLSSFALTSVLWQGTASAQWIIDGRKYTPPDTSGIHPVYHTTDAVDRWIALPSGLALEVWSVTQQQWVRQVEYTED